MNKKRTGIWQTGQCDELIGIHLQLCDTPVSSLDSSNDFPNSIHTEAVSTALEYLKITRPVATPLWVTRNPGADHRRTSSRQSDSINM